MHAIRKTLVVRNAIWNSLLAPEMRLNAPLMRQAKRVVALHLAMLIWVPIFTLLYYALSAPVSADVILSGGVLLFASLMLLRQGHSPSFCGNFLTGSAWYVYTGLAFMNGGAVAPVVMWYASIPILAVLMCGTRSGLNWTMLSAFTIACFTIAMQFDYRCAQELTPQGQQFMHFTGLIGLLTCVYILVYVLKRIEADAQEALHEANRTLEQQATIDVLTGIGNRRSFDLVLDQECRRHVRTQSPLSVLMLDVDLFKQFNDELGHLAGDDCLRSIAQAIGGCLRRPADFVARYGGEEFAVILPDTDEISSFQMAETIRCRIQGLKIPHPGSAVCASVTVSIGLSTSVPHRNTWYLDLVHDADIALYRAKAKGRNQSLHVDSMECFSGHAAENGSVAAMATATAVIAEVLPNH
jgi:diguanylate cyclase (GGDEF)-like protein